MRRPNTPEKRKARVHVNLDGAVVERLDKIASERGTSRSELLREMVDELIEREDEARWLAGGARGELGEETIPWDQAKRELGV